MNINQTLANEFKLRKELVDDIIAMVDTGKSISFIAERCGEQADAPDNTVLYELVTRLAYLRNREEEDFRKQPQSLPAKKRSFPIERIFNLSITAILVCTFVTLALINYRPGSKDVLNAYLYGSSGTSSETVSAPKKISSAENTSSGAPDETGESGDSEPVSELASTSMEPAPISNNPDLQSVPIEDEKAVFIENTQQNDNNTQQIDNNEIGLININDANLEQLKQLNGIGDVKAQAIIDYREAHGAFSSVDDITKVKGIGDGTLEKIRDHITVD